MEGRRSREAVAVKQVEASRSKQECKMIEREGIAGEAGVLHVARMRDLLQSLCIVHTVQARVQAASSQDSGLEIHGRRTENLQSTS